MKPFDAVVEPVFDMERSVVLTPAFEVEPIAKSVVVEVVEAAWMEN